MLLPSAPRSRALLRTSCRAGMRAERRGSISTSCNPRRTSCASARKHPASTSARFALWATNSCSAYGPLNTSRAWRVSSVISGWTSTQCHAAGTGMETIESGVARTRPPTSSGPTLSPCRPPLAMASPVNAKGYKACCGRGVGSNAFAATSAATADAAEPPIPELTAMPLSISISKPNGSLSSWRIAINAIPAVFRSVSSGSAAEAPRIATIRTVGSSMTRTVARSPGPSRL